MTFNQNEIDIEISHALHDIYHEHLRKILGKSIAMMIVGIDMMNMKNVNEDEKRENVIG
jgi:hypothetical protein